MFINFDQTYEFDGVLASNLQPEGAYPVRVALKTIG